MVEIKIQGEIDSEATETLKHYFEKIAQYNVSTILFDFNEVDSICSSGIAIIISLNRRIAEKKIQIEIVNANEVVYELFLIMKLNHIFKISRKS